jgi:aryl-alcohol dehydrogenase-like predicted oxidoreductase
VARDSTVERRILGNGDLEVSVLGLGCLSFSDYYGTVDAVGVEEARGLIDRPAALDVTLLDTAAMWGRSEALVGYAVKGGQDDWVIASKFSIVFDDRDRANGMALLRMRSWMIRPAASMTRPAVDLHRCEADPVADKRPSAEHVNAGAN